MPLRVTDSTLEAHHHPRPVLAPIGGREIAEDAAPDDVALGLDPDGLDHDQVAVALDRNVADELDDAFDRGRRLGRQEQQAERERTAPKRRHAFPPGKPICGAAASARLSSSKNGSSRNPSVRATITSGNDWTLMLRLRTAPL